MSKIPIVMECKCILNYFKLDFKFLILNYKVVL
jgi:hypothetical protein